MLTAILTHEVKNYADWKPFFDGDEPNRAKSGFQLTGLYQAVDNPNLVTIIFEVPDVESVNGFISNPELKKTMDMAGVISKPDMRILKKI